MNIIEKIIDAGIASNIFQATHIANGLRLFELSTDEEKISRCRLYRDWRNAGEPSNVAYQHAIDGDPLMSFPGDFLHSESK